jgi:uncharacterized membrane protein YfcA
MNLDPGQWIIAVVAAVLVGIGKTGVSGLGMLPVAIYAQLVPARQASGLLLPLLIVADVVAVLSFHHHAQWRHLLRLFPWTGVGVVAGYFAMGRINDRQAAVLTGVIILVLAALHMQRKRSFSTNSQLPISTPQLPTTNYSVVATAAVGILAGFTTLIANAAGPLMAMYLLAMRLPKLEFVGTSAIFFLVLNVFKVPFMADLGLINFDSLGTNLALAPAVVAGALLGRRILARLNQRWFEHLALALAAAAGVKLLF